MLARKHRLDKKAFESVFSNGMKVSGSVGYIRYYSLSGPTRVSCVATKGDVSKSVDRTRIRRRGYEAVEESWGQLPEGVGVIWFLPKKAKDIPFAELSASFKDIIEKADFSSN